MFISYKTVIRLFSFIMAAMLILLSVAVKFDADKTSFQRQLENGYIRSIQELSSQMNAITISLQKAGYAGTPSQLSAISARVWKDAGSAKSAMGNLPVYEMNLDSTYLFLSQVGDYAMYLAKKSTDGETLTVKEREDFHALLDYAINVNRQLTGIERVLSTGQISVQDFLKTQSAAGGAAPTNVNVSAVGFKDMEEGFAGYPTLIYDGPFSDNLMKKAPELTISEPEIEKQQAKEIAANFASLSPLLLSYASDEESHMPSYIFKNDSVQAGVTKNGGYVTYMIVSRPVGEKTLSIAQARRKAAEYLSKMGISPMRETYYEVANGICTVNFAYAQDNVLCYTDLIKVGVAMDDGSIMDYNARGYISNHKPRQFSGVELDEETARKSLNGVLRVKNTQLALIPANGKSEVLAYEFLCEGRGDEDVLVYINAQTGAEEQILILIENENGILTI